MAWCEIMETHPDKLHLAGGVSNASAKLNIIDSNGFGVLSWFEGRCRAGKYQERDALYIYTATGEKVILISGGGKEGDERYIKGKRMSIALTHLFFFIKKGMERLIKNELYANGEGLCLRDNPVGVLH